MPGRSDSLAEAAEPFHIRQTLPGQVVLAVQSPRRIDPTARHPYLAGQEHRPAMKFAFPAQLLIDATGAAVPADLARAKELGYDGVEIPALGNHNMIAADETLPLRFGELRGAGIEIACLTTSLTMPPRARDRGPRDTMASGLRRIIDAAAELDCRLVRIDAPFVPRGTTPAGAAADMANWLLPLADRAGQCSVTIVVANTQSFRTARPLWTLLETIDHPNVGASWDLLDGLRAGQSPHVAVPTLNSRMQYVRLADADHRFQSRNLGEGDLPVRDVLDRLRGIGYAGYITYAPLTPDDLGPALHKLKEWTKPQLVDKPKRTSVPSHK